MQLDDTFLARWLEGNLTEAEMRAFQESPDYEDFVRLRKSIERMSPPPFSEEKSWRALLEKVRSESSPPLVVRRVRWVRAAFAVAAGLAFVLAAVWFLGRNNETIVRADIAEKRSLDLPDGSRVTLNADSKIRYQPGNWDDARTLALEGEAYFEVKPGNTFEVRTASGEVTVLGTKFNVRAKRGDQAMEVACYEGKVRVAAFETNGEATIVGGQSVQVTRSGIAPVQPVSDTLPPWSRGESVFQSARLRAVFDELERQYRVEVKLENVDEERTFTGKFVHNDLAQALKMICTPMRLRYSVAGKAVSISPEK